MSYSKLCDKCGKKMIKWPDDASLFNYTAQREIFWKCGCGNQEFSHTEFYMINKFEDVWQEENNK